jgi:hypothetical protein
MKIVGIVLIVLGSLSVLGALIGASRGHNTSFGGVAFIVLGAYLVSRAAKNQREDAERARWEKGEGNNKG